MTRDIVVMALANLALNKPLLPFWLTAALLYCFLWWAKPVGQFVRWLGNPSRNWLKLGIKLLLFFALLVLTFFTFQTPDWPVRLWERLSGSGNVRESSAKDEADGQQSPSPEPATSVTGSLTPNDDREATEATGEGKTAVEGRGDGPPDGIKTRDSGTAKPTQTTEEVPADATER